MIKLFNTLTRRKEIFRPMVPGHISMYVCGNTVYDHCHLGHARAMVLFDMMVRYFRARDYQVTFVRNITDIDDKIIQRAQERDISIDALTSEFIDAMHEDTARLNIHSPDHEPRATEHVDTMIRLITRLMEKGHAYVSANGDVCFEVATFPGYGRLSHQNLEGLQAGARVDVVQEKRSPLDFVLWKAAKPQEPSWPSPWGAGRPGWHIECSAMSMSVLGEQFDIHGGGGDLQFPHHENEIAQSEAATGKPFANYWLHVGMLQVNNEKMAKSIGNFFTIRDVATQYKPEIVRYFLMSSHYRSTLNYTEEQLTIATKSLARLYQVLHIVLPDEEKIAHEHPYVRDFHAAMEDDFNTPVALSVLFQLAHEVHRTKDSTLSATLRYLANILGLLEADPDVFFQGYFAPEQTARITAQIAARNIARQNRHWGEADAVRDALLAEGIALQDRKDSTVWYPLDLL